MAVGEEEANATLALSLSGGLEKAGLHGVKYCVHSAQQRERAKPSFVFPAAWSLCMGQPPGPEQRDVLGCTSTAHGPGFTAYPCLSDLCFYSPSFKRPGL